MRKMRQGRQARPAARTKAAAASRVIERRPLALVAAGLFLLALAGLAVVATSARGAPGSQTPSVQAPSSRELEVQVWTGDEHQLPVLEREVVRLLQENPHSALGHHLLAHVQVRFFSRDPGDLYLLKQASDLAQQAIDLEPTNPVGYVALADILDLMGNADRAVKLLDDSEKNGIKPNWRFAFTRARLVSDAQGSDKVLKQLEQALAFKDSEPRIIVPYVVALLQSEASGEELIAQLESWNKRFPSPLFDLTAAITYADLGKFQTAHALYQRIIKGDPLSKEAKVNDAILLYRDLKESGKAVALFERALAEHKADLTPQVEAMITAHLGAAYLQQKQYDKATEQFAHAVALEQGNMSVLDFVTRAYRDAKAPERLVGLLHQLNDTVPGSGVLYALLGETLSERLHKHDDALRAFADAITLDPDRSDYYNGMGLAYYRKKALPDALKLFVAATEIDPNDATARYNEACVLSLLGRGEEAISTLAEAVTLDPRLVQTAKGDADFAALQENLKFKDLVQDGGDAMEKMAH